MKQNKENIQRFLSDFIEVFFEPTVKRRTLNNRLSSVTKVLKSISRNYFDDQPIFSERDVAKALLSKGFVLANNYDEPFDLDKAKKGSFLMDSLQQFVNIKAQKIKDLRLTTWRISPERVTKETFGRIQELRLRLTSFWNDQKRK